jgi:glycerol uptake facilitator-like aquaporin
MLLTVIVGAGIMADNLATGNDAAKLFACATSTGAALTVLITILGPISGAHLNPAVSVVELVRGKLTGSEFVAYVLAQIVGGLLGAVLAHAMFGMDLVSVSFADPRWGPSQWGSEVVATFGLLITILGCARRFPEKTAAMVGIYIFSAFWFTGSASFANPAVTIGRTLTASFTGIRPMDVFPFVIAQILGGLLGLVVWRLLDGPEARKS